MVINLTEGNIASTISSHDVVLIDFWAPWCGPCRILGPIIDSIGESNKAPNVAICKVNVDSEGDLAVRYSIRNLPSILILKGGEIVERCVGLKKESELLSLLGKHI